MHARAETPAAAPALFQVLRFFKLCGWSSNTLNVKFLRGYIMPRLAGTRRSFNALQHRLQLHVARRRLLLSGSSCSSLSRFGILCLIVLAVVEIQSLTIYCAKNRIEWYHQVSLRYNGTRARTPLGSTGGRPGPVVGIHETRLACCIERSGNRSRVFSTFPVIQALMLPVRFGAYG